MSSTEGIRLNGRKLSWLAEKFFNELEMPKPIQVGFAKIGAGRGSGQSVLKYRGRAAGTTSRRTLIPI